MERNEARDTTQQAVHVVAGWLALFFRFYTEPPKAQTRFRPQTLCLSFPSTTTTQINPSTAHYLPHRPLHPHQNVPIIYSVPRPLVHQVAEREPLDEARAVLGEEAGALKQEGGCLVLLYFWLLVVAFWLGEGGGLYG